MFTLILSNPFCYQCIFIVEYRQVIHPSFQTVSLSKPNNNSGMIGQIHQCYIFPRVSPGPLVAPLNQSGRLILDCHVSTSVAKGTGRCTALAHPKALLAPCIHPSITNPHVNCTSSCKCSSCRIYPTEFMEKCICFCWAIGN